MSAAAQPNIVLTPEERRVFGQLFQQADVEGTGVVTGDVAVKFFEKSGLNPRILGEVLGRIHKAYLDFMLTGARFGELRIQKTRVSSSILDSA